MGEKIKQIRDELGLNQVDFGRQLGFESPMSISYYEKNKREPDLSTLVKIAEMGKVSLDYLLTGLGWSFTPSSSSNAIDWFQKRLAKGVKKY